MGRFGRTVEERGWKLERVKASSEHQASSSRPSALVLGAGFTDPRGGHLTNIERTAVWPISELEFANFAQVPAVANIAALELDSKLVSQLERYELVVGRGSACVFLEGEQPRMGLPRARRGLAGWIKKCPSRSRVPQPFCSESDGDPRSERYGSLPSHGLEHLRSTQPVVAAAKTVHHEARAGQPSLERFVEPDRRGCILKDKQVRHQSRFG